MVVILYLVIKSNLRQLFLGLYYYLVFFVTFLLFIQTTIFLKEEVGGIKMWNETVNWVIYNFHSNSLAISIYLFLLYLIAIVFALKTQRNKIK